MQNRPRVLFRASVRGAFRLRVVGASSRV